MLGGAVLGSERFIVIICLPVLRSSGPSSRRFNAWVSLKGLKRLRYVWLRKAHPRRSMANGWKVGPEIARVYCSRDCNRIPGGPGRNNSRKQGCVVAFEVKAESSGAQLQLTERGARDRFGAARCPITANLGDTRSTYPSGDDDTWPDQSTDRERAGITEALIRIAVGLESVADLKRDLAQALKRH